MDSSRFSSAPSRSLNWTPACSHQCRSAVEPGILYFAKLMSYIGRVVIYCETLFYFRVMYSPKRPSTAPKRASPIGGYTQLPLLWLWGTLPDIRRADWLWSLSRDLSMQGATIHIFNPRSRYIEPPPHKTYHMFWHHPPTVPACGETSPISSVIFGNYEQRRAICCRHTTEYFALWLSYISSLITQHRYSTIVNTVDTAHSPVYHWKNWCSLIPA